MTNYQQGLQAEEAAARHLESLGWSLQARRFRGRKGEIDLIAQDGETWVFVEVKFSQKQIPYEAVQPRQILRLRQAAQEYLQLRSLKEDVLMRFDVLLVSGSEPHIEHLQDAF